MRAGSPSLGATHSSGTPISLDPSAAGIALSQSALGLTTLDVAQSAERLMLSGYNVELAGSRPPTPPLNPPPPPGHVTGSEVGGLLESAVRSRIGNPSAWTGTAVTPVIPKDPAGEPGGGAAGIALSDAGSVASPAGSLGEAPEGRGGAGRATQVNQVGEAHTATTESLHLTLLLRRTLSELDSRSKHLSDCQTEKVALHGEVERFKIRLEKLTIESAELQRRTEEAESRARQILDDENATVDAAQARAVAAEKRFEILVDWSRKEESKRMVAEGELKQALQRLDEVERKNGQQVADLRRDLLEIEQALDSSNASNLEKHKALMDRETTILDLSKKLAVSEQISSSCQSESVALKNLTGKLEVELEGTKSRLASVEGLSLKSASEMGEELKRIQKEKNRLQGLVDEGEDEVKRIVDHWRRVNDGNERKIIGLLTEKEDLIKEVKTLESRLASILADEKRQDSRLELSQRENEDLKRKIWGLEAKIRDSEAREQRANKERDGLLEKNESLNKMVDGLEADFAGRLRYPQSDQIASPSLLRYNVKPAEF